MQKLKSYVLFLHVPKPLACYLSMGYLVMKVFLAFNRRVNNSGMEKRFETSGDPQFNRTSTGAEVDHSTRNLSAHRSSNTVSILHCNG